MTKPAIKVEGLWKEYIVGHAQERRDTFYELLTSSLKAPLKRLRKLGGQADETERFWALKDVNFEVQPGEVVGVIGRNGAGKSTLLKILSRITAPTKGRIEVRGRLASLLEVGTGFHPELSGRENIFLNGAILGMTRREVARKFDEIVAFAETEKFIDTPVKRYSSGMYVRLAFGVAAHLETDVLLVDEVLAVGDSAFQRKSIGKMNEVAKGGRTVLFVSHNLSAVRNLCSRTLLMEDGSLKHEGATNETLSIYETGLNNSGGKLTAQDFSGPLANQIIFSKLVVTQDDAKIDVIDPMREFELEIHGTAMKSFTALDMNIAFYRDGLHIASCHDSSAETRLRQGSFVSRYKLPSDLFRAGRYTIGIGAVSPPEYWLWGGDIATLIFSENLGGRVSHRVAGVVSVPYLAERIQ
jgi:lipopolysaccharide transport system ATP-binding protein